MEPMLWLQKEQAVPQPKNQHADHGLVFLKPIILEGAVVGIKPRASPTLEQCSSTVLHRALKQTTL